MEHLPKPSRVSNTNLKARLLTRRGYDHKMDGFIDYPDRESWQPRSSDDWRKIFRARNPEFLAFLQRWLYFGLLECVFEKRIEVSSFTDDNHHLSTRKLIQYANERRSSISNNEHVLLAMKHAIHMHLHLYGHYDLPETPDTKSTTKIGLQTFIDSVSVADPRDSANVMATSLLIDFLTNFLPHLWDNHLQRSADDPMLLEPTTGSLWTNLKTSGWCPSEITAIAERFSVSGFYYMTHIRPSSPGYHLGGAPCSQFQCNFRKLDDASYRSQHALGCLGNCGYVGADQEELAKILVDHNEIPLIDATAEWSHHQQTPKINLVPWNGFKSYVAISHVWADGLGNPNANALPRCQMSQLSSLVQRLTGQKETLFWLDTICVPPDSALKGLDPKIGQRQRKAQDQAITKMRQTYEESAFVLVIDAWIRSDTQGAMTDVEKLMRIFCSGWNTRLWTYQEGALAKRLFFQLKDEIYDIDKAIDRIQQSQDLSVCYTLQGPLIAQYNSLRGFRTQKQEKVEKIKFLATALSLRTTSVSSDEALCLSTLMGFNVQDILDVRNPDPNDPSGLANARMEKFWSMFDQVPLALMKFESPTLPGKGYAWAPSTLLLSKERPVQSYKCFLTASKIPASRIDKGLSVCLPGLTFRSSVPIGLEFYVEDESGTFYHFYFRLTRYKNLAQSYTHNHSGFQREESCIRPQDVVGSDFMAFIYDEINNDDEQDMRRLSHVTESGILVAMFCDPRDGSWSAKKLGNAYRKTILAPQQDDEKYIRSHIMKSPQNQRDYETNRLRYPASKNGTLLCAKGREVQPQTWIFE